MNIGVFDSGLGGLSILRSVIKQLPEYNCIYLGDNARVPYGGRSRDSIYEYTVQAVDYLFKQNCQLIIIACNTATSVALRKIQQEWLPLHYPDRRILGVIRPAVEMVLQENCKNVGIIATRATVHSNSFLEEIHKLDPSITVTQQACPLLVPIIEEGELDWDGLDSVIDMYLQPLKSVKIDSLILGCTHYELIADKIKKHLDTSVKIIAEGAVTAEKLKKYLICHPEIDILLEKYSVHKYFFTDVSERYEQLAAMFLGEEYKIINILELANIDK